MLLQQLQKHIKILILQKYQTSTAGYEYWANQITSGALSLADLSSTLTAATEINMLKVLLMVI